MQNNVLIPQVAPRSLFEVRIVDSKPVAQNQWSIWVKRENGLPPFAPGQFCMLSLPELKDPLLGRPFAIVERKDEMYQFIYRVTGKFTHLLATLGAGTRLGLMGPLGRGFKDDFFRTEKICSISGGVGYASMLPVLDRIKLLGGPAAKVLYGVRSDIEIIRRSPFPVLFSSEDGSQGLKGRLPDLVREHILDDFTYLVCGSSGLMRALFSVLPPEKTFYFLEEPMGCGFGICMGCIVSVKEGDTYRRKRSCLEGPIFSGSCLERWAKGES